MKDLEFVEAGGWTVRLIHIDNYDETEMVLARPIYDNKGRILLTAGKSINSNIINKIKELGISQLMIEDIESEGISFDDMMDIPTWIEAILSLKEGYEAIQNNKPLPLVSIQKVVHKLINEVKKSRIVILIPSSYLGKELHEYAHTINVTLLTLQTAKKFGYNELNIRDIAIGALLHDIGKAVTDDEKKHPEEGFHVLRHIREINLLSAHVAMQHHENFDGTGYPRGISGDKFIDYAQLCGIANTYVNMIDIKGFSQGEAMSAILQEKGIHYKEDIVKAFVQSNPSYLPGTIVRLNNGEEAIVTKIKTDLHKPFVKILSTGQEISLVENLSIHITESLNSTVCS